MRNDVLRAAASTASLGIAALDEAVPGQQYPTVGIGDVAPLWSSEPRGAAQGLRPFLLVRGIMSCKESADE
jgi:hypothetical protein